MIDEEAYNRYFRNSRPEDESTASPRHPSKNIYDHPKSARAHILEEVGSKKETNAYRMLADDNIDDIENLANILKRLCNAAWGEGWGELSPDLKTGEDSSSIILPQITIDINTREPAEGMGGLKPRLVDVVKETDDNDEPTGDCFLVYRQWYDCNIEFNIYGRNSKEARELQKKFETLLTVYSGYLKRNGVSEIIFEEETSGKCSLNFVETHPMRSLFYFIRFESIIPIRQSLINSINIGIGANELNVDKVMTLVHNQNVKEPIELDFFDGDNGIIYNFDN